MSSTVTSAGRLVARRARETHHALLAFTFGAYLSDRDRADLLRAMKRLSESLAAEPRLARRPRQPGNQHTE